VTFDVESKTSDLDHNSLGHGEDVNAEEREVKILINWLDALDHADERTFNIEIFNDFEAITIDEVLVIFSFCLEAFFVIYCSLN
jgi:hypothetical protein